MALRRYLMMVAATLLVVGCNSSSIDDLIDVGDGVARKDIDTTQLGVNAFANDGRFGSVAAQYREVRDTLRLRYVRILFAWNDQVQPSPSAPVSWGFYDEKARSIPDGVDALVVVTGLPSWMSNPANWVDGNPRRTFAEQWVRKVARRYGGNGRIIGFQIWNEPNTTLFSENNVVQTVTSATNYVELLSFAENEVREQAPGKLVLNAATTAINQNFPDSLNYNRAMWDAGAIELVDRWAIHVYGKQFERFVQSGGVKDFLNGLPKGIWVTESGAQGVNNQLAYGEQMWPFLKDEVARLERVYQYQFTEATPSDVTYGLRNLDPAFPVSDLYVFLRDRP